MPASLWGRYTIKGDTIKPQTIRPEPEGNKCIIFRDYLILPNKQTVNISDYIEPRYANLGYMENYPSFKSNECNTIALFILYPPNAILQHALFLKKNSFPKKINIPII